MAKKSKSERRALQAERKTDFEGTGSAAAKGAVAGATIGSAVPVIGTAIGGVVGAGVGFFGKLGQNAVRRKKMTKTDMDALIESRPKYAISDEVYQNQDMATANAYGRDRSIQQQEENIEQGAADTIGQAQGLSGSTSGLLSALGSINESKNAALRGLAGDEAVLQRGKMQDLYGANMDIIDEKDKAWNFNVNEPYQLQIEELRRKKKARQENAWKALDTAGALATTYASASGGSNGGGGGGGGGWARDDGYPG